ncbi:MAG: hypothetical protein HY245_03995 [Rhizobiales bacterium]|nr:hypothetical protein [Hyphomicrobiales bacterium]
MEVIFSQVAGVAGCTLNQLNAWSLRGLLKTKLLPTTAGVARKFTRKNALELAFLAAISDAGMPLELAPQLVRRWLREAGKGILKPFFVYYPVSGNSIYLDDTNLNRLAVLFYDNQDDVSGEWIDENASPEILISTPSMSGARAAIPNCF